MPSSNECRTFHPFIRLPLELRLKVWEELLNEPHLIEAFIQCENKGRLLRKGSHPSFYPVFRTIHPDRSPILLRICKESRETGLRSYEVCLSTSIDPAVRFSTTNLGDGSRMYNWRERMSIKFESLASSILSSATNTERIRRNHAKFVSKGVIFHPAIDTIWIRHPTTRSFLGLSPSLIKTDNIQNMAMGLELIVEGLRLFQYLFVPAFFRHRGHHFQPTAPELWPGVGRESGIPLMNLKRLLVVMGSPSGSPPLTYSAESPGWSGRQRVKNAVEDMLATQDVRRELSLVVRYEAELLSDTFCIGSA